MTRKTKSKSKKKFPKSSNLHFSDFLKVLQYDEKSEILNTGFSRPWFNVVESRL